MCPQRLAGSRIREKRLDRGLRQAALAETVGISASYLNLIEHNRRRIGGKLLADIARVLRVEPALLMEGADANLLNQMRNAASQLSTDMAAEVEVDRTEELAARYPGWGALIVSQAERIEALQQQLQVMSDRIAYDPQLAGSLHDVISAVSAIRSAASILVGPEALDSDWTRRFHENIHNDSVRLADSSEALIAYLDTPETELDQAGPIEQVERFLAQTGFHIAELEGPDADAWKFAAQSSLNGDARSLLEKFGLQYMRDAELLPFDGFLAACNHHKYDPQLIAQDFAAPLSAVFRRLASLPTGQGHPPFGLAVCDAAGVLTLVKTVPGFSMPRAGGACPRWPVYAALSRPSQPLRLDVSMPSVGAGRLRCYAVADIETSVRFDAPPSVQSTMLVAPDPGGVVGETWPVGVSCRICPRDKCDNRREPAMAGIQPQTAL